jgi:hypothetical protein
VVKFSVDVIPALKDSVGTSGRLNAGRAIVSGNFSPIATLIESADVLLGGGTSQKIIVQYSDRNGLDPSTILPLGSSVSSMARDWIACLKFTQTQAFNFID